MYISRRVGYCLGLQVRAFSRPVVLGAADLHKTDQNAASNVNHFADKTKEEPVEPALKRERPQFTGKVSKIIRDTETKLHEAAMAAEEKMKKAVQKAEAELENALEKMEKSVVTQGQIEKQAYDDVTKEVRKDVGELPEHLIAFEKEAIAAAEHLKRNAEEKAAKVGHKVVQAVHTLEEKAEKAVGKK